MIDKEPVDRVKRCPLLLRVFISTNGQHHHPSDYNKGRTPCKEVQIYTWLDASLGELSSLVQEINEDSRKPGTRFDFGLVFPDVHSDRYRMNIIGNVCKGRVDQNDSKTLQQAHFQIGDILDVAVTLSDDNRNGTSNHHTSSSTGVSNSSRRNGDRHEDRIRT